MRFKLSKLVAPGPIRLYRRATLANRGITIMATIIYLGLTRQGKRVGETHPRAKLSDADIDLIRELGDPDDPGHLSYAVIADKFDVSKSTIRDIIKCRRRYAVAERWIKVQRD